MSPFRQPVKLAALLAAAFSVSAVLLTLLLVLIVGGAASGTLRGTIGAALSERATHAALQFDTMMDERYREVQHLSERAELFSAATPPAAKRQLLERIQRAYPLYAWIGVADEQGKVMVSTGGLLEGADVSKRPWFEEAPRKRYVHDVHDAKLLAGLLPAEGGNPLRFVDVAFPFYRADGSFAGVLGAHLSWRWASELRRLFDGAGPGGAETLVVSANGIVLSGPQALLGKQLTVPSLKAAAAGKPGYVSETWPDGAAYLVGYARTQGHGDYPGLGWTILTRHHTALAYAGLAEFQRIALWAGLVLTLVFSGLGWLIATRITRPLNQTAQQARDIAAGERAALGAQRGSFDELSTLTGAFNALLQRLAEKRALVSEANASLEERVAARTAELARSLQTLQASEERIRNILDTAQDAFVGMDEDGNITDWNPKAEQIFGWPAAAVAGRPMHQLIIPPAMREAHTLGMARFRATGEHRVLGQRLQLTALRADGTLFPVEMTIGHVRTGAVSSFGAFVNDISQRVAIEQTLESERLLLAAILEEVDVGVVACDDRGRLTLFNRASRNLHGLPAEELPPQEWPRYFSLFDSDGKTPLPAQRIPLLRTLAGEAVKDQCVVVAREHAGPRYLLCSGRQLQPDAAGRIGAVVVMNDITERQQAEVKLAENERFLRTVANHSPALIAYADAGQVVRFANQSWQAMLGIDPQAMSGRTLRDVFGEAPYADLAPRLARSYGGESLRFETGFARSGWPRHVLASVIPDHGDDGAVRGVHIMIMDITERRLAELNQARSEMLAQSASRAKSEFVANMSHEIRTPMNAVIGVTHLLGKTALSAQQAEYVGMIRACGKSLLNVINDVLDFSKIEAGKIEIVPVRFGVDELGEAVATAMLSMGEQKDVDCILDIDPALDGVYLGDAMRLQQIVLNLVSNAVKFTARGEVLVAIAADSRAPADPDSLLLQVTVRDTGIGMDPDQVARLFAPFEQADSSTSRRFGGTGLGLAISRQLCELMGGSITVSSEPERGTTFVLAVPVGVALAHAPATGPAAGARAAGPQRLSAIDPNPRSRAALVQAAAGCGRSIDFIDGDDGDGQLSAANAEGAVLVDWRHYIRLGTNALAALSRDGRRPLIPIVNPLGQARLAQRADARKVESLMRPVTPDRLQQVLERVATQAPVEPEVVPPPRGTALAGKRILVVEDNPLNQLITRGYLEPEGALLTVANNGREALDLYRRDAARFDLVLMDVQMPVMDGYAATRALRQEHGAVLPILAMSAGVMESEKRHCIEAGMDDFIPKPIDLDQMMDTIGKHLHAAPRPPLRRAAPEGGGETVEGVLDLSKLLHLSKDNAAQRSAFTNIVRKIHDRAGGELASARAALERGDPGAAAATLHSLRGSVGSLGAARFAATSIELEAQLKAGGAGVGALLDRAERELAEVSAAIARWLGGAAAPARPADAPGANAPAGALDRFKVLLGQHDMDAVAYYHQHLREHIALSRVKRSELEQALARLDFGAARALLAPPSPSQP